MINHCQVRLLDESGMELLYSGTVSADEMYKNGSLILGQYNFTDLEVSSLIHQGSPLSLEASNTFLALKYFY
jgi:hypothetical protein